MKLAVIVLIAAVAGVMGFMAWRGECPAGAVVLSEEQCRQSGRFDAAVCALVFAAADDVTRRAATVYPTEQGCLAAFERCVRSSVTQGFTPVPAGFCVSAAGGRVQSQEPVYRRINASSFWGRP